MRIFISYAHNDVDMVQTLARWLRKGSHEVWFDESLPVAKNWKKRLLAEIEAAGCFVYALTPESATSPWCQWEFAKAVHMVKPIVPVLVKPIVFEGVLSALKDVQYVDFSQGENIEVGVQLGAAPFLAEIIPAEDVPLLEAPDSAEARRKEPESNGVLADKVFDHAYDLYNSGDYEEARERLEICLSIDPGHPAAQKLLRIIEERRTPGESLERLRQPSLRGDSSFEAEFFSQAKFVPTETPDWANLLRRYRASLSFPIPEMVYIPAGPFLMGSDPKRDPDAQEDEQPQITVDLPAYFVGKYPVTVEEYRAFIENGGYSESRWWTAAGWSWRDEAKITEPLYWDDEEWAGNPHLPLVGVSWYEVYAYTCWLDEMWTAHVRYLIAIDLLHNASPRLKFRLSTEPEWEKAVRGRDGRIYPWGDYFDSDLCNVSKNGIGHTTPVGQFSPAGDSPFGCADMAGNVWEWCINAAGDEPNWWLWDYVDGPSMMDCAVNGKGYRLGRGGSWSRDQSRARASFRNVGLPDIRLNDTGFRIICGRPIE